MMQPNIGIQDTQREAVAAELNALLLDLWQLETRTRQYHWNATGFHFLAVHEMLGAQAAALAAELDALAERVRMLGGWAAVPGVAAVRLAPLRQEPYAESEVFLDLLRDHEQLVRSLRAALPRVTEAGDEGTADFLTGLMAGHEKTAWILRSHLK